MLKQLKLSRHSEMQRGEQERTKSNGRDGAVVVGTKRRGDLAKRHALMKGFLTRSQLPGLGVGEDSRSEEEEHGEAKA